MINFEVSIRAFISSNFIVAQLTPAEKFLVTVAQLSGGDVGLVVSVSDLRKIWLKSVFKLTYHPRHSSAAQDNGWVSSVGYGKIVLTPNGLSHLHSIAIESDDRPLGTMSKLSLFPAKQTHAFDKFIRDSLKDAASSVRIADSFIDNTIFDSFLGVIPSGVAVSLMHGNKLPLGFNTHATRFKRQYPSFTLARYSKLHDRFMVIDNVGFLLGPSLKDAATNSPAIVHRLNEQDSSELVKFFDNIFRNLPKT